MAEKIQLLEISKRKLLGQSVSCCSYDELQEIEDQLQRSLLRVRQRKAQLYMEQIDQLRSQESNLLQENAKLTERILVFPFTLPPLSTMPTPHTFTSPISLKLNEDNFLVWKHQALATVTGLHLMKFLESSSYPPKYVTPDAAASDAVNPLDLDHL
ncbi:MADS-box protein AGL42-like isoform X1 [Vigna umbellata]|uniref:MADS-box protein AGL42-like isoform X1 n=1 Tax=Vigna umbellata TaxID=87088 RepID=UPI001F5F44D7|nr:MADS-box protein AGL42-like isoform X1 [Vigna umbellata]